MAAKNLADFFALSLAACLRGEQPIEMVQYAARKRNPDLGQPSLFETSNQPHLNKLGPGRWITIHSEKGEHGSHGGHAVYIGDDGKIKTGKFAGKSMDKAFGKQSKPKEKRLAKRGAKHEQGQPGLFETEAQPTLPGVGPGNFISQDKLRAMGKDGLAVDPNELRGSNIRTLSGTPDREINNRRLAASKRRLRLEREAVPLLSDQVAELQPTPEQRIRDMDKLTKARFEGFDKKQKEVWDRTVDELSKLPPDEQKRFMAYWNSGQQPDDPAYFATAFAKFKSGKVKTDAIVDRSDIADPEKRKRVERLDRSLATLQDIHSKAKSEGGKEYASQRVAEVQAQIAAEIGEPKVEESKPSTDPAADNSPESKQSTPENSRSKFRQLMQEQDADDRRKDPGRFAQEYR